MEQEVEWMSEGRADIMAAGARQVQKEIATKFLMDQYTPEFVSYYVDLPLEETLEIEKQLKAEQFAKGRAEMMAAGAFQAHKESAKKLLWDSYDPEYISDCLYLTMEEVLELQKQVNAEKAAKTRAKIVAARAEIMAEGAREAHRETAKNCLLEHISPELISRCTGLSLEEVLEIQKEL